MSNSMLLPAAILAQAGRWCDDASCLADYVWDTNEPLNLTKDGYPGMLMPNQKAGRMMVRDLQRHGLSGVYTVLHDGDGVVDASMSDVKRVWRPEPGRVDVDVQLSVDFNNGMWLTVQRSNPQDPVRNIRVLLPGFFGEQQFLNNPFHPAFVHSLKRYRILRFMEWAKTNEDLEGSWDARAKRSDLSYVLRGVPLEEMVLLANMIGADAWFCIPHRADANYITKFAELVHSSLRPDRKIYVEFSNEVKRVKMLQTFSAACGIDCAVLVQLQRYTVSNFVLCFVLRDFCGCCNQVWHTGFPGGVFSEQEASKLGITRLCYVVQRTQAISRIMKEVIGPNWRERLVVVVASQTVNSDATRQILACDAKVASFLNAVPLCHLRELVCSESPPHGIP